MGAGTSLYKISKDTRFKKLYENVCISVNSSIILFDWTKEWWDNKYWESNDVATRHWDYFDLVKKSRCNKVVRDSWKDHFGLLDNSFLTFSPREDQEDLKKEDKGLCTVTSIPTAIDLSIFMGCNKIFLLGIDHYYKGNFSYFWQFLPKDQQPTTTAHVAPLHLQNKMFKENIKIFNELEKYSQRENIKIYNCNYKSKIESFTKIDFKQIWKII